jgi:hypothetical protein
VNDWLKERKIAQLPGTERTPVNALASTLEKAQAGHIKSVYIGIEWTDGTFCGDWSRMQTRDLAMHALTADKNAHSECHMGGEVAPT